MEFDKSKFIQNLLDAPAEDPFLEQPEHSDYLQKQVFDKLAAGETVDLTTLDWNAFDLRHVTPEGYVEQYEDEHKDWVMGANWLLRKSPAVCLNQKVFF